MMKNMKKRGYSRDPAHVKSNKSHTGCVRVIVQCVVSLPFSRDTTHSQRHCQRETRC